MSANLNAAHLDLVYAEEYMHEEIRDAPMLPPSYVQTLRQAKRLIQQAKFAIEAADMILKGGLPVPEELRDVVA